MKRFRQCIGILLVAVMLLTFPVCAVEEVDSRSSSYFFNYSAYLREENSFNFRIVFSITAKRIMEELGAKTIKVQISSNGEDWATTQTYTRDTHPEFMDENTGTHAYEFNYNGSRGYYYRAIITFYAKDDTGSAVSTVYTPVIQLGT